MTHRVMVYYGYSQDGEPILYFCPAELGLNEWWRDDFGILFSSFDYSVMMWAVKPTDFGIHLVTIYNAIQLEINW